MINRIGWLPLTASTRSTSSRVARSAICSTGWRTVGELGRGALGDAEVVEADDGDVVGHAPTEVGEHPQRTGRHQVGGDDETVEVGVPLDQRARREARRSPR